MSKDHFKSEIVCEKVAQATSMDIITRPNNINTAFFKLSDPSTKDEQWVKCEKLRTIGMLLRACKGWGKRKQGNGVRVLVVSECPQTFYKAGQILENLLLRETGSGA